MKIVRKRTERYVVRCNTGFLRDGREVKTLDEATKFEQMNQAEEALARHRKRGWNALWVEQLPRPFNVVLTVR